MAALRKLDRSDMAAAMRALSSTGVTEQLARAERLSAARVEAAIAQYVSRGQWPHLSKMERFFLRQRLVLGYFHVVENEALKRHPYTILPRPGLRISEERALQWLLVEYWESTGLNRWKTLFRTGTPCQEPSPEPGELSFAA